MNTSRFSTFHIDNTLPGCVDHFITYKVTEESGR
jgi:hypothetical protein